MTKADREQLLEAIDLWKEAHCLYPRIHGVTRLLDLERQRLSLNQKYEQLLMAQWLNEEVSATELQKFVAETLHWRKEVMTEILTNGSC